MSSLSRCRPHAHWINGRNVAGALTLADPGTEDCNAACARGPGADDRGNSAGCRGGGERVRREKTAAVKRRSIRGAVPRRAAGSNERGGVGAAFQAASRSGARGNNISVSFLLVVAALAAHCRLCSASQRSNAAAQLSLSASPSAMARASTITARSSAKLWQRSLK